MKKVQRSFAVEYKSGRRKSDAKPNSIWGDMDLKSVAREVEKSAMPSLSNGSLDEESNKEVSPPQANRRLPILTAPVTASKAVADTQEIFMADETDTITNADAPDVVETPPAPAKQRKPRSKRGSPETTAAETAVGVDGVSGQKKRGRKPKVAGSAAVAKRIPVKRAPKDEQTANVVTPSAGDEMADLLQLEEENQKLRRLLAEKLRAENADLRKKLKLG